MREAFEKYPQQYSLIDSNLYYRYISLPDEFTLLDDGTILLHSSDGRQTSFAWPDFFDVNVQVLFYLGWTAAAFLDHGQQILCRRSSLNGLTRPSRIISLLPLHRGLFPDQPSSDFLYDQLRDDSVLQALRTRRVAFVALKFLFTPPSYPDASTLTKSKFGILLQSLVSTNLCVLHLVLPSVLRSIDSIRTGFAYQSSLLDAFPSSRIVGRSHI